MNGLAGPSRTSIVVLTTPRSGSSWTASLMRSTRVMGECREWLNGLVFDHGARDFPRPVVDGSPDATRGFLDGLRSVSSTQNGVSAVKIISPVWDSLPPRIAAWGLGDGCGDAWAATVFPRPAVLVLRRRDRVARAISWWRAQSTREFARFTGSRDAPPAPAYDFAALRMALQEVDRHAALLERAVRTLRAVEGAELVERDYEDMLDTPGEAVRALADAAGVALPPGHRFESELEMQRDATTEEIRARFEGDLARFTDQRDSAQ
jgi:LPS sulfotransferase NodH